MAFNPFSNIESTDLLGHFLQWLAFVKNCVLHGLLGSAPSTASTQATGASGATVVRVNLAAGAVVVAGTPKEFAAEADRVLHDTTVYTGADAGAGTTTLTTANCYAYITIVAKNAAGTVSLVNCKGGTATTAALALAARCTDAEIDTKCSSVPWVKVCDVLIYRSGDTAISQTQDNLARPILGYNCSEELFTTVGSAG
jgi:hypothetical protein